MLYAFYNTARFLVLNLPLGACYAFAGFIADIYYIFAREDRRCLEYNLTIILEKSDRKSINRYIRNIFRNFAKYLVDFLRFSKLSREYILNSMIIEGKEYVDKALADGKGAVLLTVHIGIWELGGAVVGCLGYPLYAVALQHKDKRVNDFFLKQRSLADVSVIPIGVQLKNCFKILKENKLLAIVGDRDFTNHGISTEFFGRPCILPKGPAIFSLRTGAPIIPVFALRTKNDRLRLVFEEPIIYRRTGDEVNDIKNVMRLYLGVSERYIRTYPDQWYAFRKMWD